MAAEKVTYDDHVLPIFEQVCLNCHNPDKTKGGLDLSSYQGTLKGGSGGKIVEANDPSSTLLAVVMQTSEPKMPPEGDALSSTHVETLKSWIEGGLLETSSSAAKKPAKPKFDASIQSDPAAKPDGPPPMPEHVLLEPVVVAPRASAIHAMVASPWAPLLAVTGQRQVLLFHTDTLELVGVLPFPEGDPVSLAFTPNARYLIVGGGIPGKSGLTVTFDVTNGERMLTAGKEFDTVTATDLHPSLDRVVTGSPSRLIKAWKTDDGSSISSIKKHTDWITALDFSPDGILLGSGDRNGGLWVWESESGNEFHTLRGHQAGLTAVVFRPDSNILASASEDGTVRFWEMNQGKEIKKLDAHPGGVTAFSWARDGSFATAGRNKKARLWKPDFGQRLEIKDLGDLPTAIALNTDGTRLFIGDYHGIIAVHDTEKGARIAQMDTNPPSIETRLTRLQEDASKQSQLIAIAREERDQANAKLADLKKRIADAENAAKKSKVAMKSAEHELAESKKQKTTEPTREAETLARLEKARKQSSEADQRLSKAREAMKPIEESLAKANRSAKETESEMANIVSRQRRWSAAQLNAQSMESAILARRLEVEAEAFASEFTKIALSLETARTELQQKRKERSDVAERLKTADPEHSEELNAVLAALAATLSEQAVGLKELEQSLTKARHQADQHLPAATAARAESIRLKKAYFSKLKPTP